ncbi:MAG: metallophosphoesterase [Proteobacteria bacterium]|nr:metallophosphoesterase [Pseudomonadota bacterium]
MNRKNILTFFKSAVLAALVFIALFACAKPSDETATIYHHVVILGDPHLPGRDIEKKEQVLEKINSWEDVEMVVAVGDICVDLGTNDEFEVAKTFFKKLHAPFLPIAGNHDYFYSDDRGQLIAGTQISQEAKLSKFLATFELTNYYYSKYVGDYLLVFLSADHAGFLAGISDQQLAWLHTELENNKKTPTIIIFHGPLNGTLRDYRKWINTPNFIAQPEARVQAILRANKQVFLWVSGHTHTSPLEESYASPINLYDGHVTNIHNKDMNRGTIWTNSFFLYDDKVVVKTFNHQENTWLPQLERTIIAPRF